MYFTDDDKEKMIKFLRLIKEQGKFEHTASEAVEFVTSWLYVEQTILKKISDNIKGPMKVHEDINKAGITEPLAKATKKKTK